MQTERLIEADFPDMTSTFIISSVRGAPEELREDLDNYAENLKKKDIKVHLPHNDTNQKASGFEICMQNRRAIERSDRVLIHYNPESEGSHFDLGVAFINGKNISAINSLENMDSEHTKMLTEWIEKGPMVDSAKQVDVNPDKIYIISDAIEKLSEYEKLNIKYHVEYLESQGKEVYWPARDDNPRLSKFEQSIEHRKHMISSGETQIFFKKSNDVFFDMGLAFGSDKNLEVVENVEYGPHKSYPRMIDEWEILGNHGFLMHRRSNELSDYDRNENMRNMIDTMKFYIDQWCEFTDDNIIRSGRRENDTKSVTITREPDNNRYLILYTSDIPNTVESVTFVGNDLLGIKYTIFTDNAMEYVYKDHPNIVFDRLMSIYQNVLVLLEKSKFG